MTYNKEGKPTFKRLGKKSIFKAVFETATELGYRLERDGSHTLLYASHTNEYGKWVGESHKVKTEELWEWLNIEMEERGLIEREERI
ncbi:MAG: hypothetical protein K5885_02520 [Bacteroidales bacterium]|nr:hypothetical protein [Bacteroidales bacterium]